MTTTTESTETATTLGERITQIARVAYEASCAYAITLGEEPAPTWDQAPQTQRQSLIAGVRAILVNRTVTPRELHGSWMQEKRADGWTYGPVKHARARKHPCLVPYEQLPLEQRLKDHLFRAVVLALSSDTSS
jgi:hypothetical protein